MRGLLDTSVLIARESGRVLDLDALPEDAALSVVTLAELELGVHLAVDDVSRARRLRTLRSATMTYAALPVDEAVASHFAELVAHARRRGLRPKVQDCWIAATARRSQVPIYTQDADFDGLAVEAIRV